MTDNKKEGRLVVSKDRASDSETEGRDFNSLPQDILDLIERENYKDKLPKQVFDELFGDGGPPYDQSEYSEGNGMMVEVTDPEKAFDNIKYEQEQEVRRWAMDRGRFESEEELKDFEPGITLAFRRSFRNYLNSLFTKKPDQPSSKSRYIEENENRYDTDFLSKLYRLYNDRESVTIEDIELFLRNLLDTLWQNRRQIEERGEITFFRDEVVVELGISSLEDREKGLQQELNELREELEKKNEEIKTRREYSYKSEERQRTKKRKISTLEDEKSEIKERIAEISEEESRKGLGLRTRSELEKIHTQREDEEMWLESLAYEMQRMSAEEVAIAVSELLEYEAMRNEEVKVLVRSYLDEVIDNWAQEHSGEELIKDAETDQEEEWGLDGENTQGVIDHAKRRIESFYTRSDDEDWKEEYGEITLAELGNALNILAKNVETNN